MRQLKGKVKGEKEGSISKLTNEHFSWCSMWSNTVIKLKDAMCELYITIIMLGWFTPVNHRNIILSYSTFLRSPQKLEKRNENGRRITSPTKVRAGGSFFPSSVSSPPPSRSSSTTERGPKWWRSCETKLVISNNHYGELGWGKTPEK